MQVTFPTDADGFISQECPSCEQRFKVVIGEGSDEPISWCPYCGYNGRDCWYTTQQVEYMQVVAANVVLSPEFKKLERQLKELSKGFLRVGLKTDIPKPPPPPMETDDDLSILHFPCCRERIKVQRHDKHFCVICGQEVEMTEIEAKKVFLSHKGVDKEFVNEFKKTLELLGYLPWLDEDAMPAGVTLERALLGGMQGSCGVVFFITPSFKDQGYLETEIDYAMQEKRTKGDKFAIIALQFVDEHGNMGEIPELLKRFLWKKPRNQLDALREIVRALPIVPGIVDWRHDIAGVVQVPTAKSTATELSAEAKQILRAAAAAGGRIRHLKWLGGEGLEAGGQTMAKNADARTTALWVGGLEDLQRRRFIKDVGHKGEVFEVTREGYEAADGIPDN